MHRIQLSLSHPLSSTCLGFSLNKISHWFTIFIFERMPFDNFYKNMNEACHGDIVNCCSLNCHCPKGSLFLLVSSTYISLEKGIFVEGTFLATGKSSYCIILLNDSVV